MGKISEQIQFGETPDVDDFKAMLRDACRTSFEAAKATPAFTRPQFQTIKTIAVVGALIENDGRAGLDQTGKLSYEDAVRIADMMDSLLEAGVVIDPDFDMDIVELTKGRDFLLEDKQADLVMLSNVYDPGSSRNKVDEDVGEEWLRALAYAHLGVDHPAINKLLGSCHSPYAEVRGAWHDRIQRAEAKIVVGNDNGFDFQSLQGEGYKALIDSPQAIGADTVERNRVKDEGKLHPYFNYVLSDEYAENMAIKLNPNSSLRERIVNSLSRFGLEPKVW